VYIFSSEGVLWRQWRQWKVTDTVNGACVIVCLESWSLSCRYHACITCSARDMLGVSRKNTSDVSSEVEVSVSKIRNPWVYDWHVVASTVGIFRDLCVCSRRGRVTIGRILDYSVSGQFAIYSAVRDHSERCVFERTVLEKCLGENFGSNRTVTLAICWYFVGRQSVFRNEFWYVEILLTCAFITCRCSLQYENVLPLNLSIVILCAHLRVFMFIT
jgi:hypothetical protein